jgi:hypothetical protein
MNNPARNSNIIKLIHSLKINEKRYVVLHLSKHRKNNNLLKLYKIISADKNITDGDIQKKIKDKKLASQLNENKYMLYLTILDALHHFHLRNSPFARILTMIHQSEILLSKGLTEARMELLLKASRMADEYELPQLKLELLHLRDFYFYELSASKDILAETKQLSDLVVSQGELKYLNNEIGSYLLNRGYRPEPVLLKQLIGAIDRLKKSNTGSNSFYEQYFYYKNLSACYPLIGKSEEGYKCGIKLLKLVDENRNMLKLDLWRVRYLSVLNQLISVFSRGVYKPDALELVYKEIQKLDVSENMKATTYINLLDTFIQSGEYRGSENILNYVLKNIDFFKENLTYISGVILRHNIALIFFGLEKYSDALYWVNDIINNSDKNMPDAGFTNMARILRLIIYFELDYTDLLEYDLRSTYRRILKQEERYKFDQILLKFITKSGSATDKATLKNLLIQTRDDMVKLSETEEARVLRYFSFISWLDSKIANRPFAEIERDKARKSRKISS